MSESVYLRPEVKLEPLVGGWYAWPYLIAPVQFALNLRYRLLPLLRSFVNNPNVHLAASSDPKMYGGPFMSLQSSDVHAVEALAERTTTEFSSLLKFAEDLKEFSVSLNDDANGYSLNEFYDELPASLRGLVECTYDQFDNAKVRVFEALVYDEFSEVDVQDVELQLVGEKERHFFMSTPRICGATSIRLGAGFRDGRLDELAKMRTQARPFAEVVELFDVPNEDREKFAAMFSPTSPTITPNRDYDGEDVRVRYFGHACVLVQTARVSVLFDPMFAFEQVTDSRFTFVDLPGFIDYVVVTHSHQDHFCAEMLIQLRHRVGRVVVPGNNPGSVLDPCMKLIFKAMGYERIDVLAPFDTLTLPGGELLSLPFTGEHADLDIYSKQSISLKLNDRNLLFLIDSDGVDRKLYSRIMKRIGIVDIVFIGMECHGAPLTWLYEPLMGQAISRKNNESRRLSGADCERAWNVLSSVNSPRVFVYAMGQEPWLQYMMGLKYEPDSVQLVESDRLLGLCSSAGIGAERLFCSKELVI